VIIFPLKGWNISHNLGATLTNLNSIQEEIENKLKTGNAFNYYSMQNLCLPACYPKIQITRHITIILSVVLYGCGTWSLTLKRKAVSGLLRIGCKGEYLCLRRTKRQGSGEIT